MYLIKKNLILDSCGIVNAVSVKRIDVVFCHFGKSRFNQGRKSTIFKNFSFQIFFHQGENKFARICFWRISWKILNLCAQYVHAFLDLQKGFRGVMYFCVVHNNHIPFADEFISTRSHHKKSEINCLVCVFSNFNAGIDSIIFSQRY